MLSHHHCHRGGYELCSLLALTDSLEYDWVAQADKYDELMCEGHLQLRQHHREGQHPARTDYEDCNLCLSGFVSR